VYRTAGAGELGRQLSASLAGGGPHFIVGKTDPGKGDTSSASGRSRPKRHVLDCAVFMRAELRGDA
jgi:hypothetical protein